MERLHKQGFLVKVKMSRLHFHYAAARKKRLARHGVARKGVDGRLRSPFFWQKKGSSTVCDRTTQKTPKNRKTELKKTGIAPIV